MKLHLLMVLVFCVSLLTGLSLVQAQQQAPNGRARQQSPNGTAQQDGQNIPYSAVNDQSQALLRESTSLVNLTVTVTDKHNRLISGLERGNFEVYEDNVKQSIEFFTNEDTPLSIGIIFDISGSMQDKIERARDALNAFVQTCHNNDDFFLVTFNQRPALAAEFSDGNTVMNKLESAYASGGTALYDAIYMGLGEIPRGRHNKRALLIISDGEDTTSRHSYGELTRMLKEANVQVYCIGILSPMYLVFGDTLNTQGTAILDEIAKQTGGKSFFPRKQKELENIVTRIALELRRQYSIGYLPTNQDRNGKWRKVKIRLTPPPGLPSLSVRSRDGYYALP